MSAPEFRLPRWEDFVLRMIATYKIGKSIVFLAAGLGVRNLLHKDVSHFLTEYILEYHIDPENRFLHRILEWGLVHASTLTDHKIRFISYVAFFLSAIFAAEGVGLYLRKHWAEWLVVVSTGSLLPVEFYELYLSLAWWKFVVMFGNLFIVAYLIHRITLDARLKRCRVADEARTADEAPAKDGRSGTTGTANAAAAPISTKAR
jgi:uncharacterized membrane protein (DUF2068 family)